jgi:hypothetical protein
MSVIAVITDAAKIRKIIERDSHGRSMSTPARSGFMRV